MGQCMLLHTKYLCLCMFCHTFPGCLEGPSPKHQHSSPECVRGAAVVCRLNNAPIAVWLKCFLCVNKDFCERRTTLFISDKISLRKSWRSWQIKYTDRRHAVDVHVALSFCSDSMDLPQSKANRPFTLFMESSANTPQPEYWTILKSSNKEASQAHDLPAQWEVLGAVGPILFLGGNYLPCGSWGLDLLHFWVCPVGPACQASWSRVLYSTFIFRLV